MNKDNTLTDEEIIKKVQTSDQELYSIIIKRYQDKLIRYAFYLIKDRDKAVDIVQESFINAFINLNSFDIKKKFSSYIYRIIHNQTLNFIKKYKKETPLLEAMDFESEENIEDDFIKKELKDNVDKCLQDMPILYSEPLSLYYLEEKSYKEISDILRIPMGTVAIRINRAKKIIKKLCHKK